MAGPRSILTRSAAAWALEAVAVDNMAVSRVAARLGVGWDAANDAVLKAGIKALRPLEDRLTGAGVIGIDEHVWRHRRGERCVTVIIDLTPVRDGAGPARLVDMIPGRSKKALACWLADRPAAWRQQIEIVAMDGFTGYKTTTAEQLPGARAVMDPFDVVRLAADALDETRRRVQQATTARRRTAADALHAARRTLLTRDSLLTQRQRTRLAGLFADQRHTPVEITWAVYQKMIDAHQHPDKAHGRGLMSALIRSISSGVPAGIQEIARLERTLKRRSEDTPGLLRPPRLIQRPHRGHGRQARAPTRHRPRIAQPHPLHHPIPHPHRRPQTPTEHQTTPPNRKSPQTPGTSATGPVLRSCAVTLVETASKAPGDRLEHPQTVASHSRVLKTAWGCFQRSGDALDDESAGVTAPHHEAEVGFGRLWCVESSAPRDAQDGPALPRTSQGCSGQLAGALDASSRPWRIRERRGPSESWGRAVVRLLAEARALPQPR